MKKLALSVVAILVLLTAGLLILPSFWDWNSEKARIAQEVRKFTGRDIKIAGDVSLQLLPAPAFSAGEVSLANIQGGSADQMVELEELQVQVALFPLLQGQVLVETVTLVRPQVVLEVLADGRRNWDLAAAREEHADTGGEERGPPSVGQSGEAGDGDAIRVDSFIIENGTLIYRDAINGMEEQVADLNAELAAASLKGPFVVNGSAAVRGVRSAFDVSLDRVRTEGATGLSLGLQLPDAEASLRFSGAILRHADSQSLRGSLQGEGTSLAAAIATLSAKEAPPERGILRQPFGFSSEITASASEAKVAALTLTLGDLGLEGEGEIQLGDVPKIIADLSATRLDLDKLMASAPTHSAAGAGENAGSAGEATAEPPQSAGRGTAGQSSAVSDSAALAISLPEDVDADLTLAVDTLVYRGQFARDLRATARLSGGEVEVEELAAALPGGSNLALAGVLTAKDGVPAFSGRVEAASDNLRALVSWLGMDVQAVPADRLRRMSLKSTVDADPRQLVLRAIDLRLDVSHLSGGVAVALRERAGFGIGLAVDRINLDAYLPASRPAVAEAPADTATNAPADSDAGGEQAAVARNATGLAVLGDFDANLDLRVGALVYRGLSMNGLRLDATLQQGGLVVREAAVMDFAGSSGRFAGSLANVARNPSLDGSLDISVASLSRLIKAADLPSQGPLPLESFTLSGAVNGNEELIRFDQRLAALGGELRAAGKADLSRKQPVIDSSIALAHPDLTVLLRELLPAEEIPGDLGPVDLKGEVDADAGSIRLTALDGEAAGVDLAGDLGVAFAGERPRVTADLRTGALPLAALAAGATASDKSAKTGSRESRQSGTGSARESNPDLGRWSRDPIDLSALLGFDADIQLSSSAIRLDEVDLTDARLEAALDAGVLEVTQFTATAYDGALSVAGRADLRDSAPGGLDVAGRVTADNLDLKKLLRQMADSDRFSGPVSLESDLRANGNSEAALIGSLNGAGRIDGTVTVAAKAEEQAGALVLDILGQKIREIRGVADSATLLFSAFAGAPSKVNGSFVIEQGVLTTRDTKVRGRSAEALTVATVNLPTWRLDSQTDVFRDSDPGNAYLTAKLSGNLDSPNVGIGGQPFQRQPEPEPAPSESESPATPLAPDQGPGSGSDQPKAPKPEDLLKEGLKDLLKGLGG